VLVQNSKNSSLTTHPLYKTLMLVTQLTSCCFPCGFLMWFFWPWVHNEWEIIKRTSIVEFDPIFFFPHLLWWPNHQANKCQFGSSAHVPMTLPSCSQTFLHPGIAHYSTRCVVLQSSPSRALPTCSLQNRMCIKWPIL
jgi:hypothetical protein